MMRQNKMTSKVCKKCKEHVLFRVQGFKKLRDHMSKRVEHAFVHWCDLVRDRYYQNLLEENSFHVQIRCLYSKISLWTKGHP